MRIVVLGTGPFAVPMFEAILAAGHDVPALITRPVPPPTGRAKETRQPNPMRDFAMARGIAVHAPATTNDEPGRALLRSLHPNLLAVCDFGEILLPQTLAIAPLGGINLHASLLPKYRGAAPINWAILKGEQETGVTVIHMTPKLDGGPILATARTPIGVRETSAELEPRLAKLGVSPVLESIKLLEKWDGKSAVGQPQDPALASHARRLRKQDGIVKWSRPAARLVNQVRGLQPWPGVFTNLLASDRPPVRLIVLQVEAVAAGSEALSPGQVSHVGPAALHIRTGRGDLSLKQVQPAGKRPMEIAEFLRGRPIKIGDQFGEM